MIITFLRHGETDLNRQNCFQGTIDVPLNATGREQAQQLRHTEHFDVIYTSPLIRAKETALFLADAKEDLIVDERLIEFDYGIYEGMPFLDAPCELRAFVFHPTTVAPPASVETISSLKARAASFLDTLITRYEDEHILVVSHGVIMRAMIGCLNNLSDEDIWGMDVPNCQLISFHISK